MKTWFWKGRQRGDTIVEVLIAVAIVSTIVLGGYIVTQRSSASIRDGQEQSEVQQILQGQVEHVRSLALAQKTEEGGIFADGDFCIDASDPNHLTRVNQDAEGFESKCNKINDYYDIRVSYNQATNIFKFVGTWDKLGGGTNNEVFSYRVYSGAPAAVASAGGSGGGNAVVDTGSTCGNIAAGQPPCPPAPVGGSYHFFAAIYNRSVNPPATIAGCTYDWDDGTVENFGPAAPECQEGFYSPIHNYAQPSPLLPYPALCGPARATYIFRLTMHLTDGTHPFDTSIFRIPDCRV